MSDNNNDMQRDLERRLALQRHEREVKKAAQPSLADKIRTAKDQVENLSENPGDTAEKVLRFGVKNLASAAFRGSRAVVQGLADSKKELEGKSGDTLDSGPVIEGSLATPRLTDGSPRQDWVKRRRQMFDNKIGEIANSHHSLAMQLTIFGLRTAVIAWDWCSRTYPLVLRPFAALSRLLRNGIDRKVARQGYATNGQKLRRRLYGIGPQEGRLAQFRYAAINMVTIPAMMLVAGDGVYNYATISDYRGVHVTQVNTQSSDVMYDYKIDGFQKTPTGDHHDVSFDINYSIWFPLTFPRATAAEIEVHSICDFRTFSIPTALPTGLRRLFNTYPIIIEASCHSDPDYFQSVSQNLTTPKAQLQRPSRGTAQAALVEGWHAMSKPTLG